MPTRYITVVPAYGRDYNSKKEVMAAWNEGNDFHIEDYQLSGYINKEQLEPGMKITVRYKKLTMTCNVN